MAPEPRSAAPTSPDVAQTVPPPEARPSRAQRRVLTVLAGLGVALLAGATFALTYDDLRELALTGGAARRWAPVYPVMVDVLISVTILALVAARHARWWTRWPRWLLLLLVVAGAAAAGVQRAVNGYDSLPDDALRAGVAVAPYVMLVLVLWLWLSMFRRRPPRRRPAPAPEPAADPEEPRPEEPRPAELEPAAKPAPPAPRSESAWLFDDDDRDVPEPAWTEANEAAPAPEVPEPQPLPSVPAPRRAIEAAHPAPEPDDQQDPGQDVIFAPSSPGRARPEPDQAPIPRLDPLPDHPAEPPRQDSVPGPADEPAQRSPWLEPFDERRPDQEFHEDEPWSERTDDDRSTDPLPQMREFGPLPEMTREVDIDDDPTPPGVPPSLLPTDVELVRGRARPEVKPAATTRPDMVMPSQEELSEAAMGNEHDDVPPVDRPEDPDGGDDKPVPFHDELIADADQSPPSGSLRSSPTPPRE